MTPATTAGEIALLALGVFALLAVLTAAGELARWRARGRDLPLLEGYMTRVSSWWVMVTLICLALIAGRPGLILLTLFCSFAALREFLTLTAKDRADHHGLALAFYVILPAQYLFVWQDWEALYAIFIPVLAFLFLPVVSAVRGGGRRYLGRVAETHWALMICIFCVSHLAALTMLDLSGEGDRSVLLVAWLVLVVQLSDLVDYYIGRRLGRTRIARGVSPRTWEGLAAGLAGAACLGWGLAWITPFGPWGAAAMAVLVTAAGAGGALVIAAIKADRGVRDWSHLIPGQGGLLDQLDSVIFAAPVFYYLVRLVWLG